MAIQLAQSTWMSLSTRPLVLVPVGSTEQHGPHLPVDTDCVIARAVACEVADLLAPDQSTVVAPTIAYGASGEHEAFPGTVSIGQTALRMLLIELVRSLSRWAGRIVLINGHGGNVATLASAVAQLSAEQHDIAWTSCALSGADAHAGRTETSLMLYLAPHSVVMSRATPGNTSPLSVLMPELTRGGVRSVSPSGVLGDPIGASAAEGETLFHAMVSRAQQSVESRAPDDRSRLAHPMVEASAGSVS
ncbi:mycofactocin biosynthesis peptidyl-dipeptidase MftE [Salinibacterium sp. ZJ454]|uniref:mycofactocin biosynthesis peptidyl-dipeptidase MftE n=1 Tax=Salinibacterium sp. ZJ454 TaxID=2708339 RepID=UPI00141F438A|nr:mycofactocin biosynthesis peptidyl-dipeptidase MftE [Salinibacterium sp. ZJ454]